jgi:predicted acetyltransferase
MTRMQVRILDHRRFLEAIHWTQHAKGKAVVAVRESEGIVAKFELDVSRGRAGVKPTNAAAEIECSDRLWAAVACGDLTASVALRMGLLEGTSAAAALLDNLSYGPAPFCQEYF